MWFNAVRSIITLICAGLAVRQISKVLDTEQKIEQLREQAAYRAKHGTDERGSAGQTAEKRDDGGEPSEYAFLLWRWQRHIFWLIYFGIVAIVCDGAIN